MKNTIRLLLIPNSDLRTSIHYLVATESGICIFFNYSGYSTSKKGYLSGLIERIRPVSLV